MNRIYDQQVQSVIKQEVTKDLVSKRKQLKVNYSSIWNQIVFSLHLLFLLSVLFVAVLHHVYQYICVLLYFLEIHQEAHWSS